jgi:hypothetical protein
MTKTEVSKAYSELTLKERSQFLRELMSGGDGLKGSKGREIDPRSLLATAVGSGPPRSVAKLARILAATNSQLDAVAKQLGAMQNSLAQIGAGVNIQPPAERLSSTAEDPTYGHLTWSGATRVDPRTVTPDAAIAQMGQTNP